MAEKRYRNRREFISMIAAGSAATYLSACGWSSEHKESNEGKRKRPNIIFIIADDLGWMDIGYHGSEIQTPNLDRLAGRSVRFDRHYVMPTCTPTRVGLMTGRYPSRYGVLSPAYGKIFDDDTVTLAGALQSRGYQTCLSGKWHMGSPPECTPCKYGFDSSYGYFHGQIDPYTHDYKTGDRSWHRNDNDLDEEGHATDLITKEALRVIDSDHEKPFFLYVAYSVPHYPLNEPEEWTSIYKGKIENPSRLWYAASVTHMDTGIGQIVEAVNRKGIRDDTLIVFVSDNGGQQSWHNEKQYKGRYADKPHTVLGNNRPLRSWKGSVYEGGIRVPALANWPGVLEPQNLSASVHIVDWMPTLCKLAGYSPQKDLRWDGTDIWPLVSGRTEADEPRVLYWKTPNAFAIRLGNWKLVTNKQQKSFELYDIIEDPYEEHDLANRYPERVKELRQLLIKVSANDR